MMKMPKSIAEKGVEGPAVVPEYMRSPAAAHYLGLSESLLAKLRMSVNRSDGPRFAKIGGAVVYRRSDLDAWLEESMQ